MKNLIPLLVFAAVLCASCSGDDKEAPFILQREMVYGTWNVTHANLYGTYVPIGTLGITPTTAVFNRDGTYSADGYFGDSDGIFEIEDNHVVCLSWDEMPEGNIATEPSYTEVLRFNILSIVGSTGEFQVIHGESEGVVYNGITAKCEKIR